MVLAGMHAGSGHARGVIVLVLLIILLIWCLN